MAKRGRYKATGGTNGRPPKAAKAANAAVARSQMLINKQLDVLETEKAAVAAQQQEIEAAKASIAKREEKLARDIANWEALQQKKEQREHDRVAKAAEAAMSKLPALALEFIDNSVDTLKPKTGEVTSRHQSRMILMLYFDLVKGGSSENQAKDQVAKTLKIGRDKVLAIRTLWYDKQELYETTGKGRGKASGDDDHCG